MRINGMRRDELNRKVCGLAGSRGNCRGDEFEASIYSKHIQKDLPLLNHVVSVLSIDEHHYGYNILNGEGW